MNYRHISCSSNSPDALELKCIEVWLISCTIFVFLALLEYFVVLFGIRYDKSWSRRRQDLRRAASAAQLAPPLHINHAQVTLQDICSAFYNYCNFNQLFPLKFFKLCRLRGSYGLKCKIQKGLPAIVERIFAVFDFTKLSLQLMAIKIARLEI